ncbi:MAG: hypothetical protein JST54_33915 [Deltaproteobacteria bacterium]|nr:hypothetical protein [Deltaproteobacteria bacterium]
MERVASAGADRETATLPRKSIPTSHERKFAEGMAPRFDSGSGRELSNRDAKELERRIVHSSESLTGALDQFAPERCVSGQLELGLKIEACVLDSGD